MTFLRGPQPVSDRLLATWLSFAQSGGCVMVTCLVLPWSVRRSRQPPCKCGPAPSFAVFSRCHRARARHGPWTNVLIFFIL